MMPSLRVLVACEFSGVVRRAFRAMGYDAWSCDLLPSEDNSEYHIEGDVLNYLDNEWDLMIAHPPCRYLCNSGIRWLYKGGRKINGCDETRWRLMREAAAFFNQISLAPIPRIAIENSEPHIYAYDLIGRESQIIQPWEHGHGETKATHLWLKNLPPLIPTMIVEGRENRVHFESPGPERWKNRSRTYPGIALAMAKQWGSLQASR